MHKGTSLWGQMEMSLCEIMVRVHAAFSAQSPKVLMSLQIVVHGPDKMPW
jgi:hypothetical protein